MIRVLPAPCLAPLTTLRMGGRAVAEIRLTGTDDFAFLPDLLAQYGGIPMPLGGGSNLLVDDTDLPYTLIRVAGKEKPRIEQYQNETRIRVGADLSLPVLLSWCAAHGLSGLEGLVGIPGQVGGAVSMNAGAYGCEMATVVRELTVFTPEKGLHTLLPDAWNTGYRHFSVKEQPSWMVVVEAVLALAPAEHTHVRTIMADNFSKKKAGQPLQEHTAGCVFKNPPGESAWRLLEQAGMRGKRLGKCRFTEKHANFLAHDGGGTFTEAFALIDEARLAVARQTGIDLELEIKVWSCRQF